MTEQENKTAAFAKFLGISDKREIPKKNESPVKRERQWVITEKPAEGGKNTYKMVGYPVVLEASSKEEFLSLFCRRAKPIVEKTLGRKVSEIETEGIVRKLVRIETYNVKRPQ